MNSQSLSYSSYKSRHTVKAFTCVAPNGAVVFTSELFPGSTLMLLLLTTADKGFNIPNKLPAGVSLKFPSFLSNKAHFTKEEAKLCYKSGKQEFM